MWGFRLRPFRVAPRALWSGTDKVASVEGYADEECNKGWEGGESRISEVEKREFVDDLRPSGWGVALLLPRVVVVVVVGMPRVVWGGMAGLIREDREFLNDLPSSRGLTKVLPRVTWGGTAGSCLLARETVIREVSAADDSRLLVRGVLVGLYEGFGWGRAEWKLLVCFLHSLKSLGVWGGSPSAGFPTDLLVLSNSIE